jgi:hypothetical protein
VSTASPAQGKTPETALEPGELGSKITRQETTGSSTETAEFKDNPGRIEKRVKMRITYSDGLIAAGDSVCT